MWVYAMAWSIMLAMTVGSVLITLAVRSVVLATLWEWFAVPSFGLPPLTYAAAAGAMLVAMVFQVSALSPAALAHTSDSKADDEHEDARSGSARTLLIRTAMDTVFVPLILLAAGWLIKAAL